MLLLLPPEPALLHLIIRQTMRKGVQEEDLPEQTVQMVS